GGVLEPCHLAWADGEGGLPTYSWRCGARRGRGAGSVSVAGPQASFASTSDDSGWLALCHRLPFGPDSPAHARTQAAAREPTGSHGEPYESRSRHSLARAGAAARRCHADFV